MVKIWVGRGGGGGGWEGSTCFRTPRVKFEEQRELTGFALVSEAEDDNLDNTRSQKCDALQETQTKRRR